MYDQPNPLAAMGAGPSSQMGAGALGGLDPQTLQILMALLQGPQFPGGAAAGGGIGSTGPGGFGAFAPRAAAQQMQAPGDMKGNMKDIIAKLKAMGGGGGGGGSASPWSSDTVSGLEGGNFAGGVY